MTTVIFQRFFTRGTLEGLTYHEDSISFVSYDLAINWVDGVRRNADSLGYTLKKVSIVLK